MAFSSFWIEGICNRRGRTQQPDLVVVMQRTNRDAQNRRELLDRIVDSQVSALHDRLVMASIRRGTNLLVPVIQPARSLQVILLALQFFQVTFLWIHDWVPLGRLNDVAAVRSEDSVRRLLSVTLIQSVPWTIGLACTAWHFGSAIPSWLGYWLWITYSLLLVGQIRAWWIPYLITPDPVRAVRYQRMFGNTHAFLPTRNGLVPNTAHILLHLATAATLLVLCVAYAQDGGQSPYRPIH
jgi:hypothetical protein